MHYLVIALLIVFSILGIGLGIHSIRNSRLIYNGLWTAWQKRLTNACLTGLSASMILMSIILLAGLLDSKYIWSIERILRFALFSLIPGFLITIGTLWQFFIVNVYRKKINKKFSHQNKKTD